jgi:hypothetical protein
MREKEMGSENALASETKKPKKFGEKAGFGMCLKRPLWTV